MNLRGALKGKLTKREFELLKTSFDIVGDIAIIEIPEELEEKEHEIAEVMVKVHKNVKTVCRKLSEREGKFRLREYRILHGTDMETTHTEHGYKLKMDIRKAYFSPREGTERQRIASQVKPGETVMVMFAGVGPYPIAIAKKQKKVGKIYAVEFNPYAHKYMKFNIKMNKLGDKIIPIKGDVTLKCPKYYGMCDRVVMPLPKGAYHYLTIAAECLKPQGGIIHFYYWAPEEGLYKETEEIVKIDLKTVGRKVKITGKRKVLPYGPKVWKICLDLKVSRKK